MFWKRWKEGDPLPRVLASARWRSILVVLLCAGCFAFSYYMTHGRLVPETSPEQDFWTGVFWMVISGIFFVAFLPSVFLPTRITMDSEGFSVRNVWRGEQRYRWKDISYFDIINMKYPYIIWVNKVDDGNWRRRWYYYDHKLPSAMWTHRIKDIFAILSCWLDNHNERHEALYRAGLRLGDVVGVELFAPPLIGRLVGRPYRPGMSAAYARLCLAILAPLMLRDGVIDPDLFEGDALHAPELVGLAGKVSVRVDGNPDGNAMAPQRIAVTRRDGGVTERAIAANLGSVAHPMSAAQSAAKYDLCRRLAGPDADPRIFDDPLAYMANS